MKAGLHILMVAIGLALVSSGCSKSSNNSSNNPPTGPVTPAVPGIEYWLTSGDRSSLLRKQVTTNGFSNVSNSLPTILVDSILQYQTIEGFGYTFTEGSAHLIKQLPALERSNLLNELFGDRENSIGVSYLRLGIGATDLSTSVYSYNDMPTGQTDVGLANFSLARDQVALIPLLKTVLQVNPNIKLLATPWSPPVWMKDNGSSIGGSLNPGYYQVYANYFVKYIQAMQSEGLTIHAVTPQNEPLHPGNNPSLLMTASQQATFIKNNLGPSFAAAGINTKIIVYDHNCDRPDYPLEILNDPAAAQYVDGSAFHLYAGDISVLSSIHAAFPSKNLYFTEQYTSSGGEFGGDLVWHMKNVIIGSMRNYSKIALEWNLANDPSFGPHTPGGCTTCLGAVTITTNGYSRNVAYYIIGQVAKFVPPGSRRIASNNQDGLMSVAFLRPDGKKILLVLNEAATTRSFNIKFKEKWLTATLPAVSVATYLW